MSINNFFNVEDLSPYHELQGLTSRYSLAYNSDSGIIPFLLTLIPLVLEFHPHFTIQEQVKNISDDQLMIFSTNQEHKYLA